jgi:sulfonate transport system permease protein
LYSARKVTLAAMVPLILLVLWEGSVRLGWLPASQSAGPIDVTERLALLITAGEFPSHLSASTLRLLLGVGIGGVLGTACGVFVAVRETLRAVLAPSLAFFAGLPVVVWMPFWIMLFGIGEAFRTGLVAIATFFLVYASVFNTATKTSNTYRELLLIYQKSWREQIVRVYVPASMLAVFTALRVALALGWIILFFVEYAISEQGREGLGWFIANARATGRVEDEFAGLLALGTLAFLIDFLASRLQRRALRWAN